MYSYLPLHCLQQLWLSIYLKGNHGCCGKRSSSVAAVIDDLTFWVRINVSIVTVSSNNQRRVCVGSVVGGFKWHWIKRVFLKTRSLRLQLVGNFSTGPYTIVSPYKSRLASIIWMVTTLWFLIIINLWDIDFRNHTGALYSLGLWLCFCKGFFQHRFNRYNLKHALLIDNLIKKISISSPLKKRSVSETNM